MTGGTQELEAFRREVRAFLAEALAPEVAAAVEAGRALGKEALLDWHRRLHAQGWVAPGWPREEGGTGWSEAQKYVFEEECALASAPLLIPMGLTIVGPLLIAFGSAEQKRRHLPAILAGEEVWCQGFSEPEAGSDLASLRCRAVRDGDDYVVEGSKIWTTQAHWSDWCLLLARTSSEGRKQQGITILLVDMKSPGVSVRPLPSLDGLHVLNQVYFDCVRVPAAQRVGAENDGWRMLKATIGHERVLVADVGRTRMLLRRLGRIAAAERRGGTTLAADPRFAARFARLEVRLKALELCVLRVVNDPALALRPEASMLKVQGTELQQEVSRLTSDALGPYALPYRREALEAGAAQPAGLPVGPDYAATVTPFYFFWRKASISAGTNEIQRNIIARSLLS